MSAPDLDPIALAIIETVAAECAAEHAHDGWNLRPDAYEVLRFPGDVAALASRLGSSPTGAERIAFERAIRVRLPGGTGWTIETRAAAHYHVPAGPWTRPDGSTVCQSEAEATEAMIDRARRDDDEAIDLRVMPA